MDWVKFLSVCFHIMIFSATWTTVFWIKDKLLKIVSFIVVSGVYIYTFQSLTPNMGEVLMDHDVVGQAVIDAWEFNVFQVYLIYLAVGLVVVIAYLIYLAVKFFKKSKPLPNK